MLTNWGIRSDTSSIVFRDLITILFIIAMVFVVLLIINQNPDQAKNENSERLGNIRVEIVWPRELPLDFDLWMRSPNGDPVGYTNKVGQVYSLVRDDLGTSSDLSGLNYEVGFSRGIPAGEHTFNIHWYADRSNLVMYDDPSIPEEETGTIEIPTEIPIKAIISIMRPDTADGLVQKVFQTIIYMTYVGEEQTIVSFIITNDGDIVQSSINSIYTPIVGNQENPHVR